MQALSAAGKHILLPQCHARRVQRLAPAASAAGPQRPARSSGALGRRQQSAQQQVEQQLQRLEAPQQAAAAAAAGAPATLASLAALWALAELPAEASDLSGGPPASSYYVSLGLFLITVPGGGCCLPTAAALGTATRLGSQPATARPVARSQL